MTGRQFLASLIAVSSMGLLAHAQQYNLTTVTGGFPGQVLLDTVPRINNSGQVIGNFPGGGAGYVFSGGVLTQLPSGFLGLDINNKGAIAMFSKAPGTSVISLPPYTTQTSMGNLPSCIPADTAATGLNDSGAAVGVAEAPSTCPLPFFSFNGQMTAMGGTPPNAKWMAINNSNQVVGYELFPATSTAPAANRAVQLVNGTLTDLDPANASAYDSEAMAINDAGQFIVNSNETLCTKRVGLKLITFPCRGVISYPLLYTGSTYTNMGGLGSAGGTASGINLWGDVVGTSQTASGSMHAFLYSGGSMTDLNSHLSSSGVGWTIQKGYDINDFGQIVALASNSNGASVVLLSPVPVTAPAITSLTLNPVIVVGGIGLTGSSNGIVTLASAAPAGGIIVFLSSSSMVAHVPSMIRVASGSTAANFAITTNRVAAPVNVTITAANGSSTKTAVLNVTPVGP
jgi:probable HAF family extracellular repeat protein